jgi:hypothetical protein
VFGPRKRDIDPIDALGMSGDSCNSVILDCGKDAHLQEANRGLAFFKRARISDQGNNDDFCFLTLEGVHCTDANLREYHDIREVGFRSYNFTDVSRDLNLSEPYLLLAR